MSTWLNLGENLQEAVTKTNMPEVRERKGEICVWTDVHMCVCVWGGIHWKGVRMRVGSGTCKVGLINKVWVCVCAHVCVCVCVSEEELLDKVVYVDSLVGFRVTDGLQSSTFWCFILLFNCCTFKVGFIPQINLTYRNSRRLYLGNSSMSNMS